MSVGALGSVFHLSVAHRYHSYTYKNICSALINKKNKKRKTKSNEMTFDFIGFSLYSKLADVVFERKKKNRRLLCAAENSVTVDWWWLETTTGAHVYPSDRVSISPKRQPLNDEINEVIGRRMQNMTQASERASEQRVYVHGTV